MPGGLAPFTVLLLLRSGSDAAFLKRRAVKGVRLDDETPEGERGRLRLEGAFSCPAGAQPAQLKEGQKRRGSESSRLWPNANCRLLLPAHAGSIPSQPVAVDVVQDKPFSHSAALAAAGGAEPALVLTQTTLENFTAAVPTGAAVYYAFATAK